MKNIHAVYREKWIPADSLHAKPSQLRPHTHAVLPFCLTLYKHSGVPQSCWDRGSDQQREGHG